MKRTCASALAIAMACAALLLAAPVSAQAATAAVYRARPLTALTFTDTLTGYAVGQGSTILKTANAGASWAYQDAGFALGAVSFEDVDFASPTTGLAVGSGGRIVRTVDAGAHWTPVTAGALYSGDSLTGVTFGTSRALAVGQTTDPVTAGRCGVVYSSTDGGATWVRTTNAAWDPFSDVEFAGGTATIVSEGGSFYTTTDGVSVLAVVSYQGSRLAQGPAGTLWSFRQSAVVDGRQGFGRLLPVWGWMAQTANNWVWGISGRPGNLAWMAGAIPASQPADNPTPAVWHCSDADAFVPTWTLRSTFSSAGAPVFTDIEFPTNTNGVIVGRRSGVYGYLLQSANAGVTWADRSLAVVPGALAPSLTLSAPSRVRAGARFSVSGMLRPAHGTGDRVSFQAQRKVGTRWVATSTTVTGKTAAGTGSSVRWTGAGAISTRGTYRVRAAHAAHGVYPAITSVWRSTTVY